MAMQNPIATLESANSLPHLFHLRTTLSPDAPAYTQFDGQQWMTMTWAEAAQQAARWQAAFEKEGLQAGDRVAICLRNCIEWMLFDMAALGLGLITVPLYFNDRADNMAWSINDAGVKLLFIGEGQVWRDLKEQVPDLKRAVCLKVEQGCEGIIGIDQWLPEKGGAFRYEAARREELSSIVYTSGTTGRPKGVMLTHDNILSNVIALQHAVPEATQSEVYLSFLPLSHMFERTVGYYVAVLIGCRTVYARGITELAEDMLRHKPTLMVTVPRIFERIYTRIQEGLPPGSLKRRLFEKTAEVGWRRFRKEATIADHLWWPLLDRLVARKLRARLGGRIRFIFLGGAPMSPQLFKVFMGMGLKILHGYGLTETSPVIGCNRVNNNDPLSIGLPLERVEVRCSEQGELLTRGPIVMRGYWNNPEATAAAIDKDGWFHTGDLAKIRDGRIYITGRLKDIIVLSSGEKVPPADAEQAIQEDPVFEHVMVVGEGRAKLGMLVVSSITDLEELGRRANHQLSSFPGYARICHVARVDGPWSVENGLLTPTLKLKRNKVEERFAQNIEHMYSNTNFC